MRLAAEVKMGYYPVTPGTIAFVADRVVKLEDPGKTCILDPCCGKGAALEQLAQLLHVPVDNTYGVELDESRATSAKAVLGQVEYASFFGVSIVPVRSFSLVWANPPYDNEATQGDRRGRQMEVAFVEEIARLVQPGGVLVLHAPVNRMGHRHLLDMLHRHFEKLSHLRLPPELMPFGECLAVGIRRKESEKQSMATPLRPWDGSFYVAPPTKQRPRSMNKFEPTDVEIAAALEKAPFWNDYKTQPKPPLPRPILPLNAGHLGLVLAGGQLDGAFCPADTVAHVVRGVAFKEEYEAKNEVEENDKKTTHTVVISQRIKLKVRALLPGGEIKELK